MANPKIQLRHDTKANWETVNPVLLAGEVGIETDTNKFKIGDGTKAYTDLPYQSDTTGDYATKEDLANKQQLLTPVAPVVIKEVPLLKGVELTSDKQYIQYTTPLCHTNAKYSSNAPNYRIVTGDENGQPASSTIVNEYKTTGTFANYVCYDLTNLKNPVIQYPVSHPTASSNKGAKSGLQPLRFGYWSADKFVTVVMFSMNISTNTSTSNASAYYSNISLEPKLVYSGAEINVEGALVLHPEVINITDEASATPANFLSNCFHLYGYTDSSGKHIIAPKNKLLNKDGRFYTYSWPPGNDVWQEALHKITHVLIGVNDLSERQKPIDRYGLYEEENALNWWGPDQSGTSNIKQIIETRPNLFIERIQKSTCIAKLDYDTQLLTLNSNSQLTVNLDEIGADLITKANTDLSNITQTGKQNIMDYVQPSYENKTTRPTGTYTETTNGYLLAIPVKDSGYSIWKITIAGVEYKVYQSYSGTDYPHQVGNWFMIPKNTEYTLTTDDVNVWFIPMKGEL